MAGLFRDYNPFQRVAANQHGMVGKSVARGSLIAFHYPRSYGMPPNIIHDPYPLVIVTDIWPVHVRGVNLHYLTFPYIKNLLQNNCSNTNYSYFHVRGDRYIAQAFRMYYRVGMSQIKIMDCDFLLNLLAGIKSWSESEIDAVKEQVRQQIRRQLQLKANELNQLEINNPDLMNNQNLNYNQNRQLNQKATDVQNALQGGLVRNLQNIPPQPPDMVNGA
jgi:hypothetical protein